MTLGKKLRIAGVAAAVLLLLVFVPTPSETAPAWTVHLVDEHGAPVADAAVMEAWQFSGWGENDHSALVKSDSTGTITLAPQREWGSLAQRVYYRAAAAADSSGRREYLPSAFIFVPVDTRYTASVRGPSLWRGEPEGPLETTFVLADCLAAAQHHEGCPAR
ncbi:MAG TPA: hypothetical protein VL263_23720 [Vicinamibacterales bacterium]|nr:hypothetical protein [Vicinamibacterales bacterium]